MAVQTITDLYPVNDSTDTISLEVSIGFGQPSASRLFLDFSPLGGQKKDDFQLDLGSNASLKGRKLICSTTVWDLRTETDQTSVTVKLTGGKNDYDRTATANVSEKGGVAFFVFTIYFTA